MDCINKKDLLILKTIRANISNEFGKLLKNKTLGKKIENSIFKFTIDYLSKDKVIINLNYNFKKIYAEKSRSLYNNIDPNNKEIGNTNFIKNIKKRNIDIDKIAFMKREEIFPEKWNTYIEKKQADLYFQFEENKSIITDQFKCMACKNNKCSYYSLQIRSCDEPETCFITCLTCQKKWKQEG